METGMDEVESPTHHVSCFGKGIGLKRNDKEEEEHRKVKPVGWVQLFRYASRRDGIFMVLGTLCSIGHGALMPLFTIFLGDIINVFSDFGTSGSPVIPEQGQMIKDALVAGVRRAAVKLIILAVAAGVLAFGQVYFWMRSAQKQGNRIRERYIQSVFAQEMGWFDQIDSGELTTRVAGDVDLIQAGMGDKVASALQFTTTFFTGFIIGFVFGWKMTLIIFAATPVLAIAGVVFGKMIAETTGEGQGHYAEAGAVADEVLGMIRIVTAFGGRERELARYDTKLDKAYRAGVRKAGAMGMAMGFMFMVIFFVYALAFYVGNRLVSSGEMMPGSVLTVFFSVFFGAMSLGQSGPAVSAVMTARGAAPKVFEIIERDSQIDPFSDEGEIPDTIHGEVHFENVAFSYPSRPDTQILRSLNLSAPQGKTLALVGPSGCGKSTAVLLLERFYDPSEGTVKIGGVDIRKLNVTFLRSQIGFVSQMPTLFAGTIRENIALGAPLVSSRDESGRLIWTRREVSMKEIESSAKKANAHNFIMKLPEKYDTVIGERGAMLSGGQRQRIAIARALIRDPAILLLDEATSALDAASEKVVQEALERASQGRTTIVIAHRLSTIKDADSIAVLSGGGVVEQGSHADLMMKAGIYRNLVELQNIEASKQEAKKDSHVGHSAEKDVDDVAQPSQSMTRDQSLQESVTEDQNDPVVDKGVTLRAFRDSRSHWLYIMLGIVGSAGLGVMFPLMSWIFSIVLTELASKGDNINFWCGMFVVLGLASFIVQYLQFGMLGISGEGLTRSLRSRCFAALLRQEMAYFDERENSVGSLIVRLSTEATLVQGLTGQAFGIMVQIVFTLLSGIIIAFTGCWYVALLVLGLLPFIGIGGAIQMKLMTGFDANSKTLFSSAGRIASEAVDNNRVMAAIGAERHFLSLYKDALSGPLKSGLRTAIVGGAGFGFAEFFIFGVFAFSYWLGSTLTAQDKCSFLDVNKALNGLLFAGMTLGQAAAFIPDIGAARVAATKIYRLIDRHSSIDPSSPDGRKDEVMGEVNANDVGFHYPTRPEVRVLRNLSFSVRQGMTLALVGESGCGKSTVVSLLERFYDVDKGEFLVDGVALVDYNVARVREQMSIVTQDPDLFDASVRDNITYGLTSDVSDDDVEQVARAANAHDFISELVDGYQTRVGERGGQLSGGQRQRIAIARALIRNPKILLLDEATSALDSKSEHVVQQALDLARVGRTTIIIAHRLSTVKNADAIAVVKGGGIAEIGTHDELMSKNEIYAGLVKHQMLAEAAQQ